jgi:crotonobetainyl-CoA:carnitine CoA-transferase CaiB-like acyl-CoA transferase
MLLEVEHPTAGKVRMAGMPVKFSATPASLRFPPPLLGQHSEEVLQSWLAMPEEKVQELKRKKII